MRGILSLVTANPLIDQLAADVRLRSADRPSGVTAIAEHIAGRLHGMLTDEQIGAVLLCTAGAAMSLAVEFGLGGSAVANGLAVAGEQLYHHLAAPGDAP